jgi:predicted nucleic acid-binding protein
MKLDRGKVMFDSNIVIYSTSPDHPMLAELIELYSPVTSVVSYIESLGFHGIASREQVLLEKFFAATKMLPLDVDVRERAVALRQQRKMSLGDAIIAATALVHDLVLVTRNVDDFKWITNLRLYNPFDLPPEPLR